ncbi:MAG: PQQ-binding-like beta-propeller repeat protein [Candidatus Brocadiia bacterium]
MTTKRQAFALATGLLLAAWGPAPAADWPTWRHDPQRSASSPEELAPTLHLQWVLRLPPLEPCWPDEPRMAFDGVYQPVVQGRRLFLGSPRADGVAAFDTRTGERLWRTWTGGPVRFAPLADGERLYVASDDGLLYCLDAASGRRLWRHRGGPSRRLVLGNERLVSTWPVRGGPALADGRLYVASGIWPFMGVFLEALEPATGEAAWRNDGTGALYVLQPHNSPAFAGPAPQGYLAVAGERLLVPNGRAVPACLERDTGELLYYHPADPGHRGSVHAVALPGHFVNDGLLFALSDGEALCEVGRRPVIHGSTLYVSDGRRIRALALREAGESADEDDDGPRLETLWRLESRATVRIRAGSRLYATRPGAVEAIALPEPGGRPEVSWRADVEGTPATALAADGRLFVVTREGGLYCFGGQATSPRRLRPPEPQAPPQDRWREAASEVLAASGVREGYALVLGAGTGRLAEELARQSKLHVVAVDPSAERVGELRRRLDAAGLYGRRAAAIEGDPLALALPPYLASLVASEDLDAAGLGAGRRFVERLFRVLRPYGGTACLALSPEQRPAFLEAVHEARLANVELRPGRDLVVLRRAGALPGAGDWTHQYADAANTCVSRDERVRAPLGLLWFGGPSSQGILPRHGHGPPEQVVGGRLIIEGPDRLRALDVYTGRLLWERELPGLGRAYDNTSHQPGANAIGTNYVATADSVYVAYGRECLRLDPATGATLAAWRLPTMLGAEPPRVSALAVADEVLVVGGAPRSFPLDAEFVPEGFAGWRTERLEELARWLGRVRRFSPQEPEEDEEGKKRLVAFAVHNLNRLLDEPRLLAMLPPDAEARRRARDAAAAVALYLRTAPEGERRGLRELNRRLLEAYRPSLPRRRFRFGAPHVWSGTSSRWLVAMDRRSGRVLWSRFAAYGFHHNAIALGGGMVLCIDRLPLGVLRAMERRGEEPTLGARLLAFDLQSGLRRWSVEERVFGTWLAWSREHRLVLQAARPSRDMLPEPGRRMAVHRGSDGSIVWDRPHRYTGPPMLHGDTIITQGRAFDLLTGEPGMRRCPITGAPVPWRFTRNYGCNTAVGSRHLLTFRSAAAGFYDLAADGGTANLGGFRSGCTSNLLAANGVLNAPDYTRTCTCSYPIRTSLALIHDPQAELWTFNPLKLGDGPVRRVGLNLAAPGDRMAPGGTLWLEVPRVGGPSPRLRVQMQPEHPAAFRHHSSWARGEGLPWVAASGVVGLESLRIELGESPDGGPRPYTVRLHFVEPQGLGPGERAFHVTLQGKRVVEALDVAAATGGARRPLVRTFHGIAAEEALIVGLVAAGEAPPVLCGVEVVAERW